jgi:hypothetical protein
MKHVKGRVIVRVDTEQKNFWTFANGMTIRLERDFDNLDRKYTQQVMGVCVDGENIPTNALILFHHNSLHETYQVLNHSSLSGDDIAGGIKIFSIMERDVFFWKMPNDETWNPTPSFATALRVFKPYEGIMVGIEPKIIKDVLFVTSGELKGKVVKTLKSCDYQITFRNEMGVDEQMIRFRPNGDEEREPEAIAIMNDLTKQVKNGKLLVGISVKDAKPLNEIVSVY